MVRKFINRLLISYETGLWIGLVILLAPVLLIIFIVIWPFLYLNEKKFGKEFSADLVKNDGLEFFTYTSKKSSKSSIERDIIPYLPKELKVVLLEGKKPITDLDDLFVSQVLYRLKNIGFPNLVKIQDGQIHDISVKKEFYNALNQSQPMDEVVQLIYRKLEKMRSTDTNKKPLL
ncbi:MAG: hypothetical protein HRU19_31150 [Pseudobacteriovorax sp.]|nr:hypothetical protein [Pseudobacteriovorax sp.]